MPVCIIVKTINPRCRGRPDALWPRAVVHQGPISSTSLRRVFVLKTSYEVRTLKIGFHQTIELCEVLIFCHIFKTNV